MSDRNNYLTTGDIVDVKTNGVPEYEKRNLTRRQMKKELYTIMLILWDVEPCPICLDHKALRFTCRGCNTKSCYDCFQTKWYHFPEVYKPRIDDKRCNLCSDKCPDCKQIYPYPEGHKCS